MEPMSSSVCMVKLCSAGCAEDLHAIVARAQEQSAENVDEEMNPDVQSPHLSAASLE